jgi:hypothetical protein
MENFDVVQRAFSWSTSESIPKFESRYLQESELLLIEMMGEGLNIRMELSNNSPDVRTWMKIDGRQVVNTTGNISECLQKLSENLYKWSDVQERVKINL